MKPGKEPPVAPEPQVGHACFRWTSDRTEMNRIDWIFLVFWAETSSWVRSGSRSDSGSGSGSRSGLEPGWPDESWPLALSVSWPTCFYPPTLLVLDRLCQNTDLWTDSSLPCCSLTAWPRETPSSPQMVLKAERTLSWCTLWRHTHTSNYRLALKILYTVKVDIKQ